MPVQTPALSQTQWNKRLYDAQLGSLFPIEFIFNFPSFTTSGGISYVTQSYVVPTFSSLVQIDANESSPFFLGNRSTEFCIVSLLPTPTLADGPTEPADEGNILFSQVILYAAGGVNTPLVEKPQSRNFAPGHIPLHQNQTLYVHLVQTQLPIQQSEASIILHFLQTGLAA